MTEEQIERIRELAYEDAKKQYGNSLSTSSGPLFEIRANGYIAGYQAAIGQEEWKNLYSEGLQVGIELFKEKYELAIAALKIIAEGDPISVGLDEITEIARKGLGYED